MSSLPWLLRLAIILVACALWAKFGHKAAGWLLEIAKDILAVVVTIAGWIALVIMAWNFLF